MRFRYFFPFAMLVPAMSWAGEPLLAGTWIIQPELTTFQVFRSPSLIPPLISLDRGVYRRIDCRGDPIDMPADGSFHEVKKQPFFNQMSVRVVDSHRVVVVQKLGDRTTWKGTYTVAKSGAEMTLEFENDLAVEPVTGALQYVREGIAVAGAHPITGTWNPQKLIRLSPSGSSLNFTLEGTATDQDARDTFTYRASDGRTAEGTADAHDYPLRGTLDGATLSLYHIASNVWSMNHKQNGALVEMLSAKVSDDGNIMTLKQTDLICHEIANFTLKKTQL